MPSHISHIVFSDLATRDHSWEKIRKVFKHAYENLHEKFDWYLRADDDAYIVMENLEKFVGQYDSSKPYLFGYRWNFYVKRGFADGGAYVISREALRQFYNEMRYNQTLCPEIHRAEEDQELAKCLSKIGVYPSKSTDAYGRQMFHHFHPLELESSFLFQFIAKYSFEKFEPFPHHYSRDTISMHHLSPFEMRMYHYLLYGVKYHNRTPTQPAPVVSDGNWAPLTTSGEIVKPQ
uniref:N-acetylgalactosaminide beta-1,3-galactosyltransferase n=1 Tax=Steinernema glaseri TaxID=37863 RepID=A0A1I7YHH2_9BILA